MSNKTTKRMVETQTGYQLRRAGAWRYAAVIAAVASVTVATSSQAQQQDAPSKTAPAAAPQAEAKAPPAAAPQAEAKAPPAAAPQAEAKAPPAAAPAAEAKPARKTAQAAEAADSKPTKVAKSAKPSKEQVAAENEIKKELCIKMIAKLPKGMTFDKGTISFHIDENGRIDEVEILKSTGDPKLDSLVKSTVRGTVISVPKDYSFLDPSLKLTELASRAKTKK